MDLNTIIEPLRKWWWLVLLACIVAAGSTFLVTLNQPLVYQTRTTLVIGRAVYENNPISSDFYLNQQLAGYYAEIALREPVRSATKAALGLSSLPEYTARQLPNSQLIEIVVSDYDPARAQIVANELANQLIKQSPSGSDSEDQQRQNFIKDQLTKLEQDITITEDELIEKQSKLGNLTSAREIAETQADINALTTKLATLRSNYATLLSNSQSGANNALTIIEPAALPTRPIGPNKLLIIVLSTMIAIVLSTGAAYLIEYLDDTLKSPGEITRITRVPIIGYLYDMSREKDQERGVYVADQPRSIVAEAFRSLRTNLEFVGVDKTSKTILVTSVGLGEGKTTIATNLAIVMAQGGKKVLLIDADLRKPNVHHLLGLSNDQGLSDLFRSNLTVNDVIKDWKNQFMVITGGALPPNPGDLVGSRKWDGILQELQDLADIVIIDGPPFLVAEAALLAAKADGVLLVIRYGITRKHPTIAVMEQIHLAGAKVVGVALNRLPQKAEGYYGGYLYYQDYPPRERTTGKKNHWLRNPNGQHSFQDLFSKIANRKGPSGHSDH